jgi:hypothetical protein
MLSRDALDEELTGSVLSVGPLGAFAVVVTTCGPYIVKALLKRPPIFLIGEQGTIAVSPQRCAFFDRAGGGCMDAAVPAIETV